MEDQPLKDCRETTSNMVSPTFGDHAYDQAEVSDTRSDLRPLRDEIKALAFRLPSRRENSYTQKQLSPTTKFADKDSVIDNEEKGNGAISANEDKNTNLKSSLIKRTDSSAALKKKAVTIIEKSKNNKSLNMSIEEKNIDIVISQSKDNIRNKGVGSLKKLTNFFRKDRTSSVVETPPPPETSQQIQELQAQPEAGQLRLLNGNLNIWESDEEKASRMRAWHRKNLKGHTVRKRSSSIFTPGQQVSNLWGFVKNSLIRNFKSRFVLAPDGKPRICWDLIGMIFIFYEVMMIPLKISFNFDDSGLLGFLEYLIDVFFIIDMILTFNTGYYLRGNLVTNRRLIAAHYIRTWFLMDLLASFPYARIIESANGIDEDSDNSTWISQSTRIIKIVRFFRFIRVLRLIRVFKLKSIFGKLESFISLSPTLTAANGFLRLSGIILFIAHWIACFWHLIGDMEFSDQPDTWIIAQQLQDADWTSKYLASIYWAVTTMITVGYGDIIPRTDAERIYTLFTMLLASVVFAYSMNSINTLLINMDIESQEFKNTITWVERYMRKMKLDVETRLKVKRYLEYTLNELTYRKDDETKLLSLLSDSLKDEVIKKINKTVLVSCEPLEKYLKKTFSEVFLAEMIYFFQENIYSPGETIFSEDRDNDFSLFMIMTGSVDMCVYSCNELALNTLRKGDHFGEIEFFTGITRQWGAKAADDFVSLFYLRRKDFIDLVENFQTDKVDYEFPKGLLTLLKQIFFQTKDKLGLYEDYTVIEYKCYLCTKANHSPLKCPFTHYVINKEKFLQEQIKETYKFEKSFVRRSRSRFSAKDFRKIENDVLEVRQKYAEEIDAFENALLTLQSELLDGNSSSPHKTLGDDNDNEDSSSVTKNKSGGKSFKSFRSLNKKTAGGNKPPTFENGIDMVCTYKDYFPHNNVDKVIEKINEKIKIAKRMKRIRAIRRVIAFTNARKNLGLKKTENTLKSEVYSPLEESRAQSKFTFTGSRLDKNLTLQNANNDSAFLEGISEDAANEVNERFKIAEEDVYFNKGNHQENDEFNKKMSFKLMRTIQSTSNLFQNFFSELTPLESYDGKIVEQQARSDSAGSQVTKEREAKTKNASDTNYSLLSDIEISRLLNHVVDRYGAQYIEGILNKKEPQ